MRRNRCNRFITNKLDKLDKMNMDDICLLSPTEEGICRGIA